ncbi:MAG: MurR/RpiR family transcriptional regulator [Thiomonas sp.]
MDPDSLEAQIRKLYADLSTTDRKLADVTLRHAKDLLGYSATELAHLAGVSKASAARFFRRLGYANFNAFRAHLRSRASRQSPLHRMGSRLANKTPLAQLTQHVQNDVANLTRLTDGLTDTALGKTVERLANARRIYLVGYRNSYMTAFYASALLSQIRPDVHLLNEVSGRQAELLAACGNKDVLLVVDFRRPSSRLRPMVQAATTTGMPLVVLTDAPLSEVSAQAEIVLNCPLHEAQMFDSYVGAVSLVNYLATAVTAKLRKSARQRMTQIENLHDALGDLEHDSVSALR